MKNLSKKIAEFLIILAITAAPIIVKAQSTWNIAEKNLLTENIKTLIKSCGNDFSDVLGSEVSKGADGYIHYNCSVKLPKLKTYVFKQPAGKAMAVATITIDLMSDEIPENTINELTGLLKSITGHKVYDSVLGEIKTTSPNMRRNLLVASADNSTNVNVVQIEENSVTTISVYFQKKTN